jgi:hypothetical protein
VCVHGGGTPSGGMMKLGTVVELPNVMYRAKFHSCLMNSLRASGGQRRGSHLELHAHSTVPCATARWQVISCLPLINCKKRYRFRKITLYEREVIKKQKFFIRWLELPYSYNRWFGIHSLKAAFTLSSCYHLR